VRIAFLGTGAAFSRERYNGAAVVDDHLLLDAGAPLLQHMHRLRIDPLRIDVVFLSHLHGDHILGLPPLLYLRALASCANDLVIIGPSGVERYVDGLCAYLAWDKEWRTLRRSGRIAYREASTSEVVAGLRYDSVALEHGDIDCRGYRLYLKDGVLAYAGDTIVNAALDQLVGGTDVAITEATTPEHSPIHTSWPEAAQLAARHPTTRFLFNHVHSGSPLGAAHDLQVVDL
jgi:ribonuclease Z